MKRLLVVILVLMYGSSVASAAVYSTGWQTSRSNYTGGDWTNLGYGMTNDNNRVISNATGGRDSVGYYNFGIILPADATFDSADVLIEGFGESSTLARRLLRVGLSTDGGASSTGNRDSVTMGRTTDSLRYCYGSAGANRKWGTSLTRSDIISTNFGVILYDTVSLAGAIFDIDMVAIKIWFSSSTATTFGRGSNESVDSYIRQNAATTNYNTDTLIRVGSADDLGDARATWMKFPGLKSWMSGKYIGGAYLTLRSIANTWPSGPGTGASSFAFQILQSGRNDADSANITWNKYKSGTSPTGDWATAGALNTTSDIYPTSYSAWDSLDYVDSSDITLDVTDVMRQWATLSDSGGILMRQMNAGVGDLLYLKSANSASAAQKPFLLIWSDPAPASSLPPRRRRDDLSVLDKIRIYCFTNKGALQCVE